MVALEFNNEMLIPKLNSQVYFSMFIIETWLRRICFAAYMIKFGANWISEVPGEIEASVRRRLQGSESLVYLGAESDDNIIWMTTHSELNRLLFDKKIWPTILHLTRFKKSKLEAKLQELREIRNILAHNRALSHATGKIFEGLVTSLDLAIENFKSFFLYEKNYTIFMNEDNSDQVNQHFQDRMKGNDWGKFQAFLAKTSSFYELVCLPSEPFGKYVSAARLLKEYDSALEAIIAFTINKTPDEYGIIFPTTVDVSKAKALCDMFTAKPDVWTNKPYETQNARFVCNPRIWFYENRRAQEE